MTDIGQVSLLDAVEAIVDNRGRTCPTSNSGTPLIATNCIKQTAREPVFENVRYVDDQTMSTWFRGHPQPRDVLFVCKGSPGRVALVPDPVEFCIAQDMVALRAKRGAIYPEYLYYRLSADDVQSSIVNMHVGTMIPHFKKGDFGRLRFSFHRSLHEQRGIAEVLGAFDDKIRANQAVAASADELARAVFTATTGGESRPLSSLARFVNGRAFTKDATGTGRVVIRIAELNGGVGGSTIRNDLDVSDDNTARPGDLLFAWSGSLTVKRWSSDEGIINQHIFKVVPDQGYPMWLVHQAVLSKLAEFQAIAADKATTMGHIQRRHLDEPVVVPDGSLIGQIGAVMEDLWNRALAAEVESSALADTRDELLPLLMSGKLTVKDAEKRAEEVL